MDKYQLKDITVYLTSQNCMVVKKKKASLRKCPSQEELKMMTTECKVVSWMEFWNIKKDIE